MPPSPSHSASNPQGDSRSSSSSSSGAEFGKKKNTDLPPLFYYMEMGYWEKALERAKRHPRDVKSWATIRTKTIAADGGQPTVSGTKRLALHHACFKLRSSASMAALDVSEDPFLDVCRFVLILIKMYPEATGMRESRHGCLPLHLASFASCAPRTSSSEDEPQFIGSLMSSPSPSRTVMNSSTPPRRTSAGVTRPKAVTTRSTSVSSTDTNTTSQTGMTAAYAEEHLTGNQTMEHMQDKSFASHSPHMTYSKSSLQKPTTPSRAVSCPSPRGDLFASSPASSTTSKSMDYLVIAKREEMANHVVNALLDAYPKGIRVDSEGGRLPLHTACAGRASPKVIATLLQAYPAAARHRNKDGFLPLHLAAHWGVSHPSVATNLLKAYPDATVGRNRWERTPLEEALAMAGENGRLHQASLVRALRKHPSYWSLPTPDMLREPSRSRTLVDVDEALDDDSSSDEGLPFMDDPMVRTPQNKTRKQLMSPRRASPREDPNADLKTLIKNQKWRAVLYRLDTHAIEACREIKAMTRGGFASISGFSPLHYACERSPPHQVVEALIRANPVAVTVRLNPGGYLPLHNACTWGASPQVVGLLLSSAPAACKVVDELGNVPLHCACYSGAAANVMDFLIRAYPKSVLARNKQGSLPEDICRRLRHENRKAVLALLVARRETVLNHRKSSSSGDANGLALAAMELNAREGPPTPRRAGRNQTHSRQMVVQETARLGVEVSMDANGKDNLQWI